MEEALVAVERDPLYRWCLAVDTGCSCSVSSLAAAELIQKDRIEKEGPVWIEVTPLTKSLVLPMDKIINADSR